MYNNSSQYPNSGYQSTYPQYQQSYGSGYYQGYGQYSSQTAQPTPPGEGQVTSSTEWSSTRYTSTQKDAVAQEMQQQKAQLTKQREDYVRKASVLRHELEQLRIQKQELVGNGRSPDRELGNILRQNDKLQEEIQGKMKAIHNVIEMLSSIIKDGRSIADLEASLTKADAPKSSPQQQPATAQPQSHPHSRSQQSGAHAYHESTAHARKKSETPENREKSVERACYVHYDTGLHWCRSCDEFPETAKDLLLHLQSAKHKEAAKENDLDNTPWHKLPAEPVLPSYEDAPKKRIPIKGLQFFIAAPSWYCKLCDVWIGDLHCASHHLKSQAHFQNYENFVVQNPHWEMEWLKDREKSMARKGEQDSSDSDSAKKKKKRKDKRHSLDSFSIKDKKKKKKTKRKRRRSSDSSSSSSSSDSSSDDEDNEDRSKSIRVAMRNMKQVQSIMEEDLSAKWSVLEKLVDEHKRKEQREKLEAEQPPPPPPPPVADDPLINQWMTVSQPAAKEKRMLEELKDRMRQKQEQERAKQAEMEQRRKEKEREERERQERRRREEREAAEAEEREAKRREQEEMERIRDRHQVKFRTNYRRRRSMSRSDDEEETAGRHERYYRQDSGGSRHKRDSEGRSSIHKSRNSRSRSRSVEKSRKSPERNTDRKQDENGTKNKKPPGPPSYKKLPFIGRMPLFKNKNKAPEEKEDTKEIKKQSYDQPRRTRFEPGNLPRAFMPNPEVVCFPKLSSIPPLNIPPPPPAVSQPIVAPEAPKISNAQKKESSPKPPPPPKIESKPEKPVNLSDDEVLYGSEGADPGMMGQYYHGYGGMMYPQHDMYRQYEEEPVPPPPPPHPHGMPLEPPPLPPDDDLALLGICADDMAAQSF